MELTTYETARQNILSMKITQIMKFEFIKKLNTQTDVTKQIIINYEARYCTNHNIEVDLFDEELGDITIAYDVFCENEILAKDVTRLRVSRHESYSKMKVKGVYYVG
jgi:uncharacterized beta-barrel protein YwiB (DUF1934 family)